MKTIEYGSEGEAISDADCEARARQFLSRKYCTYIKVSTATFITAVRALIHEGVIAHTEVEFVFFTPIVNIFIRPDKNGRIDNWPKGFCDTEEGFLMRLLTPKKTR